MSKITKIECEVKMAWWYPYYAFALIFFCRLFKVAPNQKRMAYFVKKALRTKINFTEV